MAIAKTRIHIICGFCGSNEMFNFEINQKGKCNNDGSETPAVFITCENCSSLTSLGEIMQEKATNELNDQQANLWDIQQLKNSK